MLKIGLRFDVGSTSLVCLHGPDGPALRPFGHRVGPLQPGVCAHHDHLDVSPVAARQMKALLRLYPRAWRERYGSEMAALIDDLPADIGVALDLLVGAGAAYAMAVRANRILSSAAAYLHGVCVAVLLQAIAFVTLVLVSQQSQGSMIIQLGPIQFGSVVPQSVFRISELQSALVRTVVDSMPAFVLLASLLVIFVLVVAAPRLVRRSLP